jgi:hypothetical protein
MDATAQAKMPTPTTSNGSAQRPSTVIAARQPASATLVTTTRHPWPVAVMKGGRAREAFGP